MELLSAIYEIELDRPIRIKRSKTDNITCVFTYSDFQVDLRIEQGPGPLDGGDNVSFLGDGASFKGANETYSTVMRDKIVLMVSRLDELPPPIIVNPDYGGRNVGSRATWFSSRIEEYESVARVMLPRFFKFCRYKLRVPNLDIHNAYYKQLENPTWVNTHMETIHSGTLHHSSYLLPVTGSPSLFGEQDFTVDFDQDLCSILSNDLDVKTYQEFLSDAQSSIFNSKYPRAVIEMAISCEIAVKKLFFDEGTNASSAYQSLENQGRINVRVVELLSRTSQDVFGESFKTHDNLAYKDIDLLFRCRNKIAHQGKMTYRDDTGVTHTVDRPCLMSWWTSVDKLMDWINSR